MARYYDTLESFFGSVLGYNDGDWYSHPDNCEKSEPWFSHDMWKMLGENHVGYPSLLSIFTMTSFLGYCADPSIDHDRVLEINKKEELPGSYGNFCYFCENYLMGRYQKIEEFLWNCVRGKLAHIYFTRQAITAEEDGRHLTIQEDDKGRPYLLISTYNFWEDLKEAIVSLYKVLEKDSNRKESFLNAIEQLDQWRSNIDKEKLQRLDLQPQTKDSPQNTWGPSGPAGPQSYLGGA